MSRESYLLQFRNENFNHRILIRTLLPLLVTEFVHEERKLKLKYSPINFTSWVQEMLFSH